MATMKKNILVVDHNQDTIEKINQYLHHEIFDVSIAGDQTVARILLEKRHMDLVITAALLPKSHGFTLAKFIVEQYPDMKIIIISDRVEDEDYREEAADCGACEFIEKPLDRDSFRQTVMSHLGLNQSVLFGKQHGDSTNLHVVPLLDQLENQQDNKEKPKDEDSFTSLLDDVKKDSDPYEINLD
jgi:DNA-binding NtrC family response regulator